VIETPVYVEALYDGAPVGYHEIDIDGKVIQVNQTELDLLGYTREEMIGKHIWEFMPESIQDVSKKVIQKKIRKKPKVEREKDSNTYTYKDLLIGMMLRYPEVRDSLDSVEKDYFPKQWQRDTLDYLAETTRKPIVKTPKDLQEHDTYVKITLFRTEELYGSWSSNDIMIEAIGLTRRLLIDYKKDQKEKLARQIAEAEASGDDTERIKLLTQYNQLIRGNKDAGNKEKEEESNKETHSTS